MIRWIQTLLGVITGGEIGGRLIKREVVETKSVRLEDKECDIHICVCDIHICVCVYV